MRRDSLSFTAFLATGLGTLAMSLPAAAQNSPASPGLAIFNQNCAMCHVPGLANSPKLGDKDAWAPRLATGREALLRSASLGKGMMPARGGNPKLTDTELEAALDYLMAAGR